MNRRDKIVKVGFISIVSNLLLATSKAVIGIISNSISIIMDAINNLTDSLSSLITIIGTKLASKEADKEHPHGHGNIEYLTSLIIAVIILATGISSFGESFKKVISPVIPKYNTITMILIVLGIAVKLFLGLFLRKKGKEYNSISLIASGNDALFDIAISFSTLVSAIVWSIYHYSIDGYIGLAISAVITLSGYRTIMSSFSKIIGSRVDNYIIKKIKDEIVTVDGVLGAYDLILHQYGPDKIMGSIHIEVNDAMIAKDIHRLTRSISEMIFSKFNVILTIGIYASNDSITEYADIKAGILELVKNYPSVLQAHGFYVDSEQKFVSIDLTFDYDEKNRDDIKGEIVNNLEKMYPEYLFNIVIDRDAND